MRIVHISDIHLTENGTEIWGINTLEHFQKAIHKIKEMDGLDGIIVSGDLSNDGSNGLMNVLIELLKKSVCRLIVAQVITIT
jgi:3',5'-cyclic AMP phosphodiesterase CpdA